MKASLTTLVEMKNVAVTIARNATKICVCRYKRVIRAIDSRGTYPEPRVEDKAASLGHVIIAVTAFTKVVIHHISVI